MTKEYILEEIRRTTKENGGKPLGRRRFQTETGIGVSDWEGKIWARWGDALREAGFEANKRQEAYDDDWLLDRFISLIQELGRFPVTAELRIKSRNHEAFPSSNTFRRLGRTSELAARVVERCQQRGDCADAAEISRLIAESAPRPALNSPSVEPDEFGTVYLLKSGRHFKIGRTNSVGRRVRELSIQLPEKAVTVHEIRTDDPVGVEAYWHKRFSEKRMNGEWFDLSAEEVRAFKRRTFM